MMKKLTYCCFYYLSLFTPTIFSMEPYQKAGFLKDAYVNPKFLGQDLSLTTYNHHLSEYMRHIRANPLEKHTFFSELNPDTQHTLKMGSITSQGTIAHRQQFHLAKILRGILVASGGIFLMCAGIKTFLTTKTLPLDEKYSGKLIANILIGAGFFTCASSIPSAQGNYKEWVNTKQFAETYKTEIADVLQKIPTSITPSTKSSGKEEEKKEKKGKREKK